MKMWISFMRWVNGYVDGCGGWMLRMEMEDGWVDVERWMGGCGWMDEWMGMNEQVDVNGLEVGCIGWMGE